MSDVLTNSVRRVPHCSHWGAYTLLVDGNRIIGVEPFGSDPAPSSIIKNVPGWADPTKRILRPLVREGWLAKRDRSDGSARGIDRYIEVSWNQALELVADEIDRVRSTHGNSSIFAGSYGWTSCGRFHHSSSQLKRMLNMVGGFTGHVDTYSIGGGQVIVRHVLGNSAVCEGGATTLDVVSEHAETILIFGALSPRTAQNEAGGIAHHTLEGYLRRIQQRKAKVVLVSPSRDDVPEWLEVDWLPIRPNADVALMLALACEIDKAGRANYEFLNKYCSGSEQFLDYLSGKSDGIAKSSRWASKITGLPIDAIDRLAILLVDTRTMITVSWALQRAEHGEQPFWAAIGLAAILGQIGLPGGGFGFGYGSVAGNGDPISLVRSPALPKGSKAISDFIPVARIADLLEKPGECFEYEGAEHIYPDTRMVYWAGGNPFHHHQDLNRLRRAWTRPETIIVQDPVWTATASRADIVLPATTSLERNDIAASRKSDMFFAMQQAIAPIGESRSDYDIFWDIASRLGIGGAFSDGGRSEMQWLETLYESSRTDAVNRLDFQMPDFASFWKNGFTSLPLRRNYVYLSDFRSDPNAHPLATESGRIVLGSRKLADLQYDDCLPHPAWLEPSEWLGADRAAREGLFHLISNQPEGKLHSQLDGEVYSASTKRNGRESAKINPEDAMTLGIETGDTVRIWNGRGQLLASAVHDGRVRPGVVILPTGSRYSPIDNSASALELAGNPNVLTLDKGTSRYGQGCSAHSCLVAVELAMNVDVPPVHTIGAPPGTRLVSNREEL